MKSGFEIRGMEELQSAIVKAYSGSMAQQIKKDALNVGGDYVVEKLKETFEGFKDTGYSRDEIVRTNARSKNNVVQLKIGWNGAQNRWRLVHLNEFGYNKMGKQHTPRGFGAIEKTIQESRDDYFKIVAGRMKDSL